LGKKYNAIEKGMIICRAGSTLYKGYNGLTGGDVMIRALGRTLIGLTTKTARPPEVLIASSRRAETTITTKKGTSV
jgi:hypothetical protein